MKQPYTTEDVQKFLFDRKILWNGVRKNENEKDWNNDIKADVQYFDDNGYTPAEVVLVIDELTFKILAEDMEIDYEETRPYRTLIADYSYEWISELLKKSPEDAPMLRLVVESKMKFINQQAEKEIAPLKAKIDAIKAREEAELEEWRKVRRLALATERGNAQPDEDEQPIIKE